MKRQRHASAPQDLERRLLTYAVTAGAALAAGAQDAAAVPITYEVNATVPVDDALLLDIDQNGSDDFGFGINNGDAFTYGKLFGIGTAPTNAFLGVPKGSTGEKTYGYGIAVPFGSYQWPGKVPPDYLVNIGVLGVATDSQGGLFAPLKLGLPTSHYYPLPLVFDIAGDPHYGWVRIRAEFAGPGMLSASIRDVGYESEAGADIHIPAPVPEPATLGLLALGAAGLALRRRRTGANPQ